MPSDSTTNIIVCGVGGQGILLASDIICAAACAEGMDAKKSEIHGMAQRGGSVISQVRFGAKVHSPLIEEGTAHFVLAFERLEALRYVHFLGRHGAVVINDLEIPPMSVLTGTAEYPAEIEQRLVGLGLVVRTINANAIAAELGNVRTANVVLLGALAKLLALRSESWESSIRSLVKPQYADLNVQAFQRGRDAIEIAA